MNNFNYIEYLKNNPLLKGEKTQSSKLITEAQESPKSKIKKSELKAKIREEIILSLKEEESGVHKLSSLTWDKITSILPQRSGLAFPAGGDVMNMIKDERRFEEWKQATMEKFGDVGIKLNPGAVWSRQVEIIDDTFTQSSLDSMTSKQSFLDRNQGSLDEAPLAEEEKEDEEEVDVEAGEEEIDIEEPTNEPSSPSGGLTAEEQEIQNSLKIAYDSAVSMGDQKLADQIGNSITFFTRTHVVER